MQFGAGMVTLGTALVFSLRNLNARTTELGRQAILPVTLNSENPWVMPDSSRHLSFAEPVRSASKPFQPMMSSSHQLRRRNSPSVHALSPTRSCMAMTSRMHSSSTARSSALSCGPMALVGVCGPRNCSRARFSLSGRSRLPTWSARNGGFIIIPRSDCARRSRGSDPERLERLRREKLFRFQPPLREPLLVVIAQERLEYAAVGFEAVRPPVLAELAPRLLDMRGLPGQHRG